MFHMKWNDEMKIICIATYEKINKPNNYFSTQYENPVNLTRSLLIVKIYVSCESFKHDKLFRE